MNVRKHRKFSIMYYYSVDVFQIYGLISCLNKISIMKFTVFFSIFSFSSDLSVFLRCFPCVFRNICVFPVISLSPSNVFRIFCVSSVSSSGVFPVFRIFCVFPAISPVSSSDVFPVFFSVFSVFSSDFICVFCVFPVFHCAKIFRLF